MQGAVKRFTYTDEQREALAESVPNPDFLDALSKSQRELRFAAHRGFLTDKEDHIACMLQIVANECLVERNIRGNRRKDLKHVEKIRSMAWTLKHLLDAENCYRPTFGIAFFGLNKCRGHDGEPLYEHEILNLTLQKLIDNAPHVEGYFRLYYEGHQNQEFLRSHRPSFNRFVFQALCFWSTWTNERPGAGKQGGPAARFLMAAVNPVIAYASSELGNELRRGGEIDEAAAGELIARVYQDYVADDDPA